MNIETTPCLVIQVATDQETNTMIDGASCAAIFTRSDKRNSLTPARTELVARTHRVCKSSQRRSNANAA